MGKKYDYKLWFSNKTPWSRKNSNKYGVMAIKYGYKL